MKKLRILILEDVPEDAELMELEIRQAGIHFESRNVWQREAFIRELENFAPDIILSDFSLPQFNALEALHVLHESGSTCPFILVTGSQGEEVAVECIQAGADDYILKNSLKRLPAAILNVLKKRQAEVERESAVLALKESEERYSLAALGANDGLWDWNLDTGKVYFSDRWKEMLGFHVNEIGDSPEEWFARIHPDDIVRLKAAIESHLEGRTSHLEIEHRMIQKDQCSSWILTRGFAVRDETGRPYRMAGSQTDITGRKKFEEQILHDALHDGLTGLANRALLIDRLGRALERSRRNPGYLFAVLFLDLDRFKLINDSLGHTVGDLLLVAISKRLQRMLRPGDTVSRPGGDEFVLLADDIVEFGDASRVASRIQKDLLLPFDLGGMEVYASASIGIALSTGHERPEDLLRDADTAMYRAKAQGRAQTVVFDPAMHARAVSMLQMENDLRRAIERGEFRMHYQPIVSLSSGRVEGFESLVRWVHPERGFKLPSEFIPIAEETGLIMPMGNWIIRECCLQAQRWRELVGPDRPFHISVNLSGKQFSQPELVDYVEAVLSETRLDPQMLRFEITESMIMDDPDTAVRMLLRLKALQVKLYLDDFGTGYSSLGYLHRFPIDTLKIDGSFIAKMNEDRESLEIVRTIILLGQNLRKGVIGEGVERVEQKRLLEDLKCDQAQGFYFYRPMDSISAGEVLQSA